MKAFFVFLVQIYQLILSPYLPKSCRFHPSCSHYALQTFNHHGIFKSLLLIAFRILRCNPLSKGGFDPVSDDSKNNVF